MNISFLSSQDICVIKTINLTCKGWDGKEHKAFVRYFRAQTPAYTAHRPVMPSGLTPMESINSSLPKTICPTDTIDDVILKAIKNECGDNVQESSELLLLNTQAKEQKEELSRYNKHRLYIVATPDVTDSEAVYFLGNIELPQIPVNLYILKADNSGIFTDLVIPVKVSMNDFQELRHSLPAILPTFRDINDIEIEMS